MLYTSIVGHDSLAHPIIFITAKFSYIHNLEKLKKIQHASAKQKRIILSKSKYEYYYNVLYPDDFSYENKNQKIRHKYNNVNIFGLCKTKETEVTRFKHHPSLQGIENNSVNKSGELKITSYIGESIRNSLSRPATVCKPQFSFTQHGGYATYAHYFEIFEHGLTRFHHSINPSVFINFFFKAIKNEEHFHILKPYIYKEPWWWSYNYEYSFHSFFSQDDFDYFFRLEYYFNTPRLNDPEIESYLKPIHIKGIQKKEYLNWLENNKPKGWTADEDPTPGEKRIDYSKKRVRGHFSVRGGSI